MFINKKAKYLIKKLNDNNFYVITDFDKTLTTSSTISTWEILSDPNLMEEKYIKEVDDMYDYYRSKEIDSKLSFDLKKKYMNEWWKKHFNLFTKYKLKEDVVNNAINNKNIMEFRGGAVNFLNYLNNKKIPLVIISAGIGNFIEGFLEVNNCYFKNIHILSNFLKFHNGVAISTSDNFIHSLNKNETIFNEEIKNLTYNKKYKILLGDQIEDIRMINNNELDNTIKIGFPTTTSNLDLFKDNFDIVVEENDDFNNLIKFLF